MPDDRPLPNHDHWVWENDSLEDAGYDLNDGSPSVITEEICSQCGQQVENTGKRKATLFTFCSLCGVNYSRNKDNTVTLENGKMAHTRCADKQKEGN